MTQDEILTELMERHAVLKERSDESNALAFGSYGAGFDLGYAEAYREMIALLSQERK